MKKIVICIALGCALFVNAWAGLGEGLTAYKKRDYAVALREFTAEAGEGNTTAQFHLGEMYKNGLGVGQDYTQAFNWYQLAAERGYADAQYRQGLMYEEGKGIGKDLEIATYWYREAAQQGHKDAVKRLAAGGLNTSKPSASAPPESNSNQIERDYLDGKIVCKNLKFRSRFDPPIKEFTFAWMWANDCDWKK